MMAVPTEFLRGLLGFLGLSAAFMTGRSAVAVRKGWQKPSRLYGWVIRTVVCVVAIAFRNPMDTVDLIVWGLAALASRRRHGKPGSTRDTEAPSGGSRS